MARPYRASGKWGDGALPTLFVVSVLSAAGIGVVEGLVGRWFNLFLIFPALIGVGAGFAASTFIARGHVRAPLAAAILAAIAGASGQIAYHAVGYAEFRYSVAAEIAEDGDTSTTVDDALIDQTGQPGFMGYAKLLAHQGTTIKHHSGDSGISFSGTSWWLLALFELLIAAGVGAMMAWARANEPYCESCRRWFEVKEIEGVGAGDKAALAEVKGALESEAWSRAAEALGTSDGKRVSALEVHRCGQCQSHEPLLVVRVTTGANTKKPKTATVYSTVLRYEDYNALHAAFAKRNAGSPPTA